MSVTSTVSPFQIAEHEERQLAQNEAFRAVRERLLKDCESRFCSFHEQATPAPEKSTFCLHRDITHALLLPLLEIHNQASRVASLALSSRPSAEPELAFRGDARSAYSWLQSLMTEEHDWCLTRGCPACVVLHILHSEPLIRIVAVGCRVSEYLQETTLIRAGQNLPSFSFWLRALGTAVQDDPFWGPDFWSDIGNRAFGVEMGVRELISQCLELRDVDVQPVRNPQKKAWRAPDSTDVVVGNPRHSNRDRNYHAGSIALKPSPFARRQARLKSEEQEWLSKAIVACWASLWLDEQKKKNRKGAINGLKRPRLSFPSDRMRSVTY
ncbi:hypothetical protein FQN54_001746 [Arachnomyces sp. PD_36]|nr:hypothetical protein FQN54_001746 [Arachnomyces sp. PD_36]